MHKMLGVGLPLFMIHGNGVDHRILRPLDAALADGGKIERHYIDLPGFGESKPLEGAAGLPELADWLENQIRTHIGDGPFALLGNSLGGLLCQEMGDRFTDQVQGIFLLAPVIYPALQDRTLPHRKVIIQDSALMQSLNEKDRELYSDIAVVQSQQTWLAFSQWVRPGLLAANLRAMVKLSKRYFLDVLPVDRDFQLAVPVSIVCGRQDHITGFEDPYRLTRRYSTAHLSIIESAGHNVHIDQPTAVDKEIRDWLTELLRFYEA